eukprot:333696-Rhodomonas_salina.2
MFFFCGAQVRGLAQGLAGSVCFRRGGLWCRSIGRVVWSGVARGAAGGWAEGSSSAGEAVETDE